MTDPTPTLEVTGPGVYPLETRECPADDCGEHSFHSDTMRPCRTCQGTGHAAVEDGPKVEIQYDATGNSELEGPGYYWNTDVEYGGPYPTAREAFAAALEAHHAS